MTIFDAVLLGIVQALGEFLPISSSAHLVLVPYLRGQAYQGLAFDVMLHAATLLAVLIYFANDWYTLLKKGLTAPKSTQGRMLWYLAAATIPAALVGFFLNDWAENTFRSPLPIAICLIVFAYLLWDSGPPIGHPKRRPRHLHRTVYNCIFDWRSPDTSYYARCFAQRRHHYRSLVLGAISLSSRPNFLLIIYSRYCRRGTVGMY